jgi:hypothetical protein
MFFAEQTGPQGEAEQQYWPVWFIDNYAVPVLGLSQLKTTAIQIMLASGPLKILAVYLSPFRPILGLDLSACFDGGVPVLMAGELNAST